MTNTDTPTYRTPEGGFVKDAPYWTVAWRNPRANRFLRADLGMTWQQAHDLAGELASAHPELQVFYTTNAAAERDGYTNTDDAGNIMVDSGRRIRVMDTTAARYPAALTAHLTAQTETAARHADSAAYHAELAARIERNPATLNDLGHLEMEARARKARRTTELAAADKAAQTAQINAWLTRHSLALREMTEEDAARVAREYHAAITAEHAEALELDDAREAYAHAGYAAPVTPAELAAGYADWDAGNVHPYEIGQARKVALQRRATLARLAELKVRGTAAPQVALDCYARGQFGRALAWLSDDTLRDLAAAGLVADLDADGITVRRVVFAPAPPASPAAAGDDVVWLGAEPVTGYVTDVTANHVSIKWHNTETGQAGHDWPTYGEFASDWAVTGSADGTADVPCGYVLTPAGEAALKSETGPVVTDDRPLCLRVDGAHVGHMAAVGDDCRTGAGPHQDPYDAASEAVGRATDN